jgi:tRNA-intron endonuclease
MWPDISRTVRLSGGVKKQILFCRVSNEIEYLEFKWFRP